MIQRHELKDCFCLVEATSCEFDYLYSEYAHLTWKETRDSQMINIGSFGDMPVNISISFWYINGLLVGFYYGCSLVVHHGMIEQYLENNCESFKNNLKIDANNFHNCLRLIDKANKNV